MMQPPRIFQSTLPQGERRLARVREKHHKRFQSTLPQGERRRSRIRRTKVSTISIHAPTRGATRHNHNENRSFRNFNPRSHKGSDRNCYDAILERGNFNPRSHKGSDGVLIDNVFCCVLFQSTLPQGERLGQVWSGIQNIISIHAPTRGATEMPDYSFSDLMIFQSTLPQGERRKREFAIVINQQFQSTLPQGERRSRSDPDRSNGAFQSTLPQGERHFAFCSPSQSRTNFNPRSHKGSDVYDSFYKITQSISIHAPTRGATMPQERYNVAIDISIHAPTRGATNGDW